MGGDGDSDILGWYFSWESILLNLDRFFNAMGKVIGVLDKGSEILYKNKTTSNYRRVVPAS